MCSRTVSARDHAEPKLAYRRILAIVSASSAAAEKGSRSGQRPRMRTRICSGRRCWRSRTSGAGRSVVGSSNGAAVHLWAALGIPWLPQTFLVPVARSGVPPDEPLEELRWAEPHAATVLARNPDLDLHHMQDPVQDRLMVQHMSYFRLKRLTLGAAYESFLRESLEPGGTIIVMECGLSWPTMRRGPRHVFQFGALGGATADEMMRGGPRVEAY